jgi:hypothetical protein
MYPIPGLALVFEFMPYTLYSKMKDEENPLSRQEVQSFTKMLLKGLAYLHDLKIMHRVREGTLILFGFSLIFIYVRFSLPFFILPDEQLKFIQANGNLCFAFHA